jgi:acyl-CoA hydrolase
MAFDPSRPDLQPYLPPSPGGRAARRLSADEAVRRIPEGSRVYVSGGATTPMHLLQAMADAAGHWQHLEIVTPMLTKRPPVFEHAGRPFRFVTTQASPAFKYLWSSGFVDVLPSKYSDHAGLHLPDGPLPVDVAVVSVSAPHDGRVSLGISVGASVVPARTAPLVIAQVNPAIPYTFGAGELDLDQIDILVEASEPLPDAGGDGDLDEISLRIATAAATVVEDGCTIQFGIGSIPDAILTTLQNRRGLRVHSGLLSDACIDLYEAGAVEGLMVTAEVVPTARMLAWIHRNPLVLMGPANLTHGAAELAALPRFVALNSTVEIALDGSANSEVVNGQVISGPGGAPDFGFGASIAGKGRSVLALRSTAGRGAVSRIVRRIEAPNPVTLPSYLADVVVTEFGRVDVRGLAGEARAEALRSIAHPDHRAALA